MNNSHDMHLRYFKRLSWRAIIAGTAITLAVQVLLTLLGLGFGLGSIHPTTEQHPFKGLGISSLIWWIISMLVSLFMGGWATGWFSRAMNKTDSILQGLLTWCMFAFVNFYFLTTSIGGIISGAGAVVNKGLMMAGNTAKAILPEASQTIKDHINIDDGDFKRLKEDANTLLSQTGKKQLQPGSLEKKADRAKNTAQEAGKKMLENPLEAGEQADTLLNKLFSMTDSTFSAADKDALANVIVKRTGKSKEEADQIVDNWSQAWGQAKQKAEQVKQEAIAKAEEAGEKVASALSKFAFLSFIGMLLGATSAALGSVRAFNRAIRMEEEVKG